MSLALDEDHIIFGMDNFSLLKVTKILDKTDDNPVFKHVI